MVMLGRLPEADPSEQMSVKAKASDGEQDTKTKTCTHVEVAQKRKKTVTEYTSPRLVVLLERDKKMNRRLTLSYRRKYDG